MGRPRHRPAGREGSGAGATPGRRAPGISVGRVIRQHQGECAAAVRFAGQVDVAAQPPRRSREMDSPKPVPPYWRVVDHVGLLERARKISACFSGGMRADARIPDGELRHRHGAGDQVRPADAQFDEPARGELERVGEGDCAGSG